MSLLALAFIGIHVGSAIADPYVSISVAAVVIPFVSAYQPFWLGIGAVALDLILALVITSLVRAHLSRRVWRAIHWLAYAAWPVALVHGIGTSPDMRSGGLLVLTIVCGAVVGGAVLWRVTEAIREVPRAERAATTLAHIRRPGQEPGGPHGEPPARRHGQARHPAERDSR